MKIQKKPAYERDNDEKNMDNMLKEFGFTFDQQPQINIKSRKGSDMKINQQDDISQNLHNDSMKKNYR